VRNNAPPAQPLHTPDQFHKGLAPERGRLLIGGAADRAGRYPLCYCYDKRFWRCSRDKKSCERRIALEGREQHGSRFLSNGHGCVSLGNGFGRRHGLSITPS
jgi:hypothetical protein